MVRKKFYVVRSSSCRHTFPCLTGEILDNEKNRDGPYGPHTHADIGFHTQGICGLPPPSPSRPPVPGEQFTPLR